MVEGNSAYETALRVHAICEWENVSEGEDPGPRFDKLTYSEIQPGTRLLDVGCGTGHVLGRIMAAAPAGLLPIGLDASPFMLAKARKVAGLRLVQGDVCRLPFADGSIDVLVSRLADYLPAEVARVLRPGGVFLEYGLGPCDSEEIAVAFAERYMSDYAPSDPAAWFACREQNLLSAQLATEYFAIFPSVDLLTRQQLEETIAMVPLAANFDADRDAGLLDAMTTRPDAEMGRRWPIRRQTTLRRARRVP